MNQQQSILVLDDHPAQRMATLLQLAALGYHRTSEAADGAAALQQLDQLETLDIVICDIRMSHMDGVEFLRRVAGHRLRPAILICSAVEQGLRRSVLFLAAQLGLPVLGDIGKPIAAPLLNKLLQRHAGAAAPVPHDPRLEVGHILQPAAFSTYYQPQYALHSLDITGVEIQCFHQHPSHGPLAPASYMPLLVKEQREALNRQVAEQGLRFVSALQRRDLTLNIALPLACLQLRSPTLPEAIQDYLERYRLSPASLSLEVRAEDFAQAPLDAVENLIRLRLKGCHLTLLPAAAALPSLRQLHELPFDQIKLNASHLWCAGNPDNCHASLSVTIATAASLGIQVLAKDIRNWQQNQLLLHMGCQIGTGDWYAPPMNESAFSQWIYPALLQRTA